MQDRVSLNPGRVLVTPEDGSAAFYATLTRADNPTQEGTALSASTLLKDTTAELFGLSEEKTPDAAFQILSKSFRYKILNSAVATKGQNVNINFDISARGKKLKLILIPENDTGYTVFVFGKNAQSTYFFFSGDSLNHNGPSVYVNYGVSYGKIFVADISTRITDAGQVNSIEMNTMDDSGFRTFGAFVDTDSKTAPYIMVSTGNNINSVKVLLVEIPKDIFPV